MQSVRDLCVIIKGVHGGAARQREWERLDNEQGDFFYFCVSTLTLLHLPPLSFHCRRMLGSNTGLL